MVIRCIEIMADALPGKAVINDTFFRVGFIVFLMLYLLACYWIFGLES